jgi:hypothetical protein
MARESYDPSYRQSNVDTTLDDHETRITRLEKIALIGFGYLVADGAEIVSTFSSLL